MLMIIGQYDEFRRRMTGVRNIEKEWMSAPQTKRVFPGPEPQLGTTYGDFVQGTARRVFVPRITHIHESHHRGSIAEALEWMRQALGPDPRYWIDSQNQTWPIKEWATFLALVAGFSALMPLGALLLRTRIFSPLKGAPSGETACSWKSYLRLAGLNGLLEWLYLPLFFAGTIPFVGPGGMFIPFVQGLFHMIILLLLTIPLSTWFFLLTGKITLGAVLNAALVTWMFVSSQVVAPLPI